MEEKYYLNFIDAYLDEEYLYAVDLKSNIFFRAKRDNHYDVEILGIINGFQNKGVREICSVQYYKSSLYMLLDCTYEIVRYDLETKEFGYYYPAEQNEVFDRIRGICRIENEIWILRDVFEKKLCVFSLEDCCYHFYKLDISVLLNNTEQEKLKRVARENICLVKNKIWRCIAGTNLLYSMDVKTKQLEIHKVESEIELFTIRHNEKGFYLVSIFGESIIWWDENTGVINRKEISNGEKVFKAFRDIIPADSCHILIPSLSDEIKLLSREEARVEICELPSQFRRVPNVKKGLFLNYFLDKDEVLLFPFGGNGLIEICLHTLRTKYTPVCISKEEFMKVLTAEGEIVIENETISLNSYISFLNGSLYERKNITSNDETSGKQIMEIIGSKR